MRGPGDLLYNFHWIVPGEAARSAQAWAGFLGPFLKARGIRGLINLRGPNPDWRWWRYEKRVADEARVAHFDVVLNSRRLPTRKMLAALLRAFDAAPRPLLLKCSGGQDRSSFAAALYLLHTRGWDALAAAEGQFAAWPYLHRPKAHQHWLKPFLRFARADAKGKPLAQWIAEDYSDAKLKAWLDANGMKDSYRGLYDPRIPVPGL
ncbi:MAG TPA: hypothetical protein VMH86_13485 [Rhizomicrobium sp.]|nr:hypothetical protein [Rhizomicrobium sp.]